MNLILIERPECAGNEAQIEGERARHVHEVLRLAPGDTLRIGLLNGPRGEGRVLEIAPDRLRLECVWSEVPPRSSLDLILAAPRPKVMRRLWPQLSALGLRRIWIVNAEKVEKPYFSSHVLAPATYEPLLKEGLQQACDTWLPEVEVVTRLKPFMEDRVPSLFSAHDRWIAHPGAGALTPAVSADRPVVVAVGPEGGWTPYELDLFSTAGFTPFSPTSRILRSDTFCITALAAASWQT